MALPEQLTRMQPYSMGPLTRWDPVMMAAFPANGTIAMIDEPVKAAKMMFIAPMSIQRQAYNAGERAIIMQRPRGWENFPDLRPGPAKQQQLEDEALAAAEAHDAAVMADNVIARALEDSGEEL